MTLHTRPALDWSRGINIGGTYTVYASANVIIAAPVAGDRNPETGKRKITEGWVVEVAPAYARQLAAAILKAADACEMKPEGFVT